MAINSITRATASDAADFINALGFDGLEANASSGALTITYNGYNVISGTNCYYNYGNTSYSYTTNSNHYYTILSCTNGLIVSEYSSTSTDYMGGCVVLSYNSDGTLIYSATPGGGQISNCYVVRNDLPNTKTNNFYRREANVTALMSLVSAAPVGDENVIAENAYCVPYYQYTGTGVLTIEGNNYVTNGYYCIKD